MSAISPWVLMIFAIGSEIAGTSFLKLANGFERPWAWLGVGGGFGIALFLLSVLLEKMDVSVVYAIWSGAAIALIAVVGVVVFHEQMSWTRAAGLLATVIGIVLLQLSTRTA
ncbi:DMT family transporter [Solimonas terrae]|uniref:Multidrug efflux SMR transporter n=1 Tax=Solimonas terrae TaxID=1396819 RepID=A0A6M2BNA9_9GAMM|nr:multidrug efflux SMR transporter [Solimonas terrae]NGY03800.1 multidrug efflux SMR transporter [Solimonas terrae]